MEERNLRKTRVGVVVSDKMDKTIVVAVKDSVQHPLYKKILKRTAKFKARAPCPRMCAGAWSVSLRRQSKFLCPLL